MLRTRGRGRLSGSGGEASLSGEHHAAEALGSWLAAAGGDPDGRHHRPQALLAAGGLAQVAEPVILMSLPLALSTAVANNPWMAEYEAEEGRIDHARALAQFAAVYRLLSRRVIIYLLPSRPGLQDQVYVANLGAVLHHREENPVVVSRFRSSPRVAEAPAGFAFFSAMNMEVHAPPATWRGEPVFFEGEADLKRIRGNLYVGAEGLRSSRAAMRWMAEAFEMEIIHYPIVDRRLYHLDGTLLPIDAESVVLCRERATSEATRAIERVCEVIPVSLRETIAGLPNSLVMGGCLYCDTTIATISRGDHWYEEERIKVRAAERICRQKGLDLELVDISEFYKSGAGLSCLVMRLNARAY